MNGRTRMMRRALGLAIAALLMGGAEALVAQRRGGGAGQREQMERRIQARFDDLVREDLALTDDQWRRLQGTVEDFRTRRLDFVQSERNNRARVGRWGGPGGGQALTEEEASEILAEMLELSGDEATLFREEQEALLSILSAPLVVRYIVMRQQLLGDRIRSLRGGGSPGRGRQGGRGSGQLRPPR